MRGGLMKPIDSLFKTHRARSGLPSQYSPGDVAYVGNGLGNNGVLAFVNPRPRDRVFEFRGIAVSAFCEATVQVPPFIACGRAGNGLTVLEPRQPMSMAQLASIAAYINLAVRWRFSWYRQTTADRIKTLLIPDGKPPPGIQFDVSASVPTSTATSAPDWDLCLAEFPLDDLFDLVPGDYHSLAALPPGDIPVVSCGDENNGIAGFRAVSDHLYRERLTIAFNGMNTLTAKYHPYTFAAKDDVAVCVPRAALELTTLIFVQTMLKREQWRYSYFRKCFIEKLRRFRVSLPAKDGSLDEPTMQRVVEATPYWPFLVRAMKTAA